MPARSVLPTRTSAPFCLTLVLQRGLFRGVKCCVFGAKSSGPVLATVAVHPGYEQQTRNVDLYIDQYIHPDPDRRVGVVNLDDLGVCLRSFPAGLARMQRWFWTIFMPYREVRVLTRLPSGRDDANPPSSRGTRTSQSHGTKCMMA